jgi:hypothetical protein
MQFKNILKWNAILSETDEVQWVGQIVSFHTGELIVVFRGMEGLHKLHQC